MVRRDKSIDEDWFEERKSILKRIKEQVRLYLGVESADIKEYAKAYKSDLERPWQKASLKDLLSSLESASLVYGGDFHPYAQAQRAHLRILREVVGKRKIVLALEAVAAEKQDIVDSFLADLITEEVFLKEVSWDEGWGFPWRYYKPLFDFAKKHNISILALNSRFVDRAEQTLSLRDEVAAEILKIGVEAHPGALIYAVFGDLHIAQAHLPAQVQRKMGREVETVSIYLNSETVYFDLLKCGLELEVDVVKFEASQFCILSSPPWVKWQSYLMYLEENFDVGLDDEEDEVFIDHTDHVSSLAEILCADLSENIKTDDIEVYSLKDPQVLKVAQQIFGQDNFDHAQALVQQDTSFYAPDHGFFYLSKSTVNHAASLAGKYIHAKMSGRNRMLWEFPKDFLALIWVEAMSFFLSKFINPKRKAQTIADLKKQLEAFDLKDRGREPLLLALDQKMSELLYIYKNDSRVQKYSPVKRSSYIHAARFLGEMLGERYFLLYQKGVISLESFKQLLRQDLNNKAFDEFYFEQLKLLDKLDLERIKA